MSYEQKHIYPVDFPSEGQPWEGGAYSLYRRMSLQSLHDEADLRSRQLQGQFRAVMAGIEHERSFWQEYGMSPAKLQELADREERLLADYNQRLLELSTAYAQQEQTIHADYDAKDQEYIRSMARLASQSAPHWSDTYHAPAPSYTPRPAPDVPAYTPDNAPVLPDWSGDDTPGPSLLDRILGLFG